MSRPPPSTARRVPTSTAPRQPAIVSRSRTKATTGDDELAGALKTLKISPRAENGIAKTPSAVQSKDGILTGRRTVLAKMATRIVKPAVAATATAATTKTISARAAPSVDRRALSSSKRPSPTAVSSAERAKSALDTVNHSLKDLTTACTSGFRYTSSQSGSATRSRKDGTSRSVEKPLTDVTWTGESVSATVEACAQALETLRELDQQGEIKNKGLEIERGASGLISRCISIGMHHKSLSLVAASRPGLLRLYDHEEVDLPPSSSKDSSSSTPKMSSSRGTSRATQSTSRTPVTSSRTSALPSAFRKEWLDLLWFPKMENVDVNGKGPTDVSQAQLAILGMLFTNVTAAWIGVLASLTSSSDSEMCLSKVQHAMEHEDTYFCPLNLANILPAKQCTSLLSLYTTASRLESSSAFANDFTSLHTLASLSLSALTRCIQNGLKGVDLWKEARRYALQLLERDDDKPGMRAVASLIEKTIATARHADASSVAPAGSTWIELLETWSSIGRRIGDRRAVNLASSFMLEQGSIPAQSSSGVEKDMLSLSLTPESSTLGLSRACAELSKVTMAVDASGDSADCGASSTAIDLLNATGTFDDLLRILTSADDNIRDSLLDKASRNLGRARMSLSTCLERASTSQDTALFDASVNWLERMLALSEGLQMRVKETKSTEIWAVAVEASIQAAKSSFNTESSPAQDKTIDFIHRAIELVQNVHVPPKASAEWLRCLSNLGYTFGAKLWRANLQARAIPFVRLSAEIGEASVKLRAEETSSMDIPSDQATDAAWQVVEDQLAKRWELLATCYQKISDKMLTLGAYQRCFAAHLPSTIKSVVTSASTLPIGVTFVQNPALDLTVTRFVSFLISEALYINTQELSVLSIDRTEYSAVLAERVVKGLEIAEHRAEVAILMARILQKLLLAYASMDRPIRRLRIVAKIEELACTTNAVGDDLKGLLEDEQEDGRLHTDAISSGLDVGLSHLRPQYRVSVCIWRAMRAYQLQQPDAAARVAQLAADAKVNLLQLLCPTRPFFSESPSVKPAALRPPAKPAFKTPAKRTKTLGQVATTATEMGSAPARTGLACQQKDDCTRLALHIECLANLLEVTGFWILKIEILRLLRSLQRDTDLDGYVLTSARLASDYARLGKTMKAATMFAQIYSQVSKPGILGLSSSVVNVELYVRYALFLAACGNSGKSSSILSEAEDALSDAELSKSLSSSSSKVRQRAARLTWTGRARMAVAHAAGNQDDAGTKINHLSSAFRLHSAALEMVARVATRQEDMSGRQALLQQDPFVSSGKSPEKPPDSGDTISGRSSRDQPLQNRRLGAVQLDAVSAFLDCAFALIAAFMSRGSAKDAQAIIEQVQDVAESIGSPYIAARAACQAAEVQIHLNDMDGAQRNIDEATSILAEVGEGALLEVERIKGIYQIRQVQLEEADELFAKVSKQVAALSKSFAAVEQLTASPIKSQLTTSRSGGEPPIFSDILAHVLRQRAWLLRQVGDEGQSDDLLEQALALATTSDHTAEQYYSTGQLILDKALSAFKSDLFMSSLTESTISMPVGCTNSAEKSIVQIRQAIVETLGDAAQKFQQYLELQGQGGRVTAVREACMSMAKIRTYQAALIPNRGEADDLIGAASLLDHCAGITLQRELVGHIMYKTRRGSSQDSVWPSIDDTTRLSRKPQEQQPRNAVRKGSPFSQAEALQLCQSSEGTPDETSDRLFWNHVAERHRNTSASSILKVPEASNIPPSWTVVTINLSEDCGTLYLSRVQRDRPPLIFSLPLDRQGRREEEDETFTFGKALGELREIIQTSDTIARDAKNIEGKEGRAEWWNKRKVLDTRMKDLLASVEFCWLGAAKTIFSPVDDSTPNSHATFQATLEKIFRQALAAGHDRGKTPRVKLVDHIVQCFAALGSAAKEQEYEDLVYFVLDLHGFYGAPVALAELDIDELCLDVQAALQTFEANCRAERARASAIISSDEHMFLVLDRRVSEIPWESIPILRGRAISRIPSFSFLLDRLDLTEHRAKQGATRPSLEANDHRFIVDARNTHYILNPSQDLPRTQAHFQLWMKEMEKSGWKGTMGKPPGELDMLKALETEDLVLYFGHGGAEQYLTSRKLRNLPRCAVTMLWGCSSGALKDNGDFDRSGTAWNYMVAGCPSLVANLWDVTDRDIDRLSSAVMHDLHLDASHIPNVKTCPTSINPISIVQAVNKNRDECKLTYLTGAAPVVYGIPVWFGTK